MKNILFALFSLVFLFSCGSFKNDFIYDEPWILSYQIEDYDSNDSIYKFAKNRKNTDFTTILTFQKNDSIEAKNYPLGTKRNSFPAERHLFLFKKNKIVFGDKESDLSVAKPYQINSDSLELIFRKESDTTKYVYSKLQNFKQAEFFEVIKQRLIGNRFEMHSSKNGFEHNIIFSNDSEVLSYKENLYINQPVFNWVMDKYKGELFLIISYIADFEEKTSSFTMVFQVKNFDKEKIYLKSYRGKGMEVVMKKIN